MSSEATKTSEAAAGERLPTAGRAARVHDARMAVSGVAVQLFLERGFDETTVDDVARASGIAPRTFYRYFPTKEDAVFPDHEQRLKRITEVAGHLPQPVTVSLLLKLGRTFVEDIIASPAFYIPRYRLVTTVPALRARAEMQTLDYKTLSIRLLSAALEPGPIGTAFATLYCGAVIDTSQGLLYEWAARDGDLDVLTVFDATLPALANVHLPSLEGRPRNGTPAPQDPEPDRAGVVVDSFSPKAIRQLAQLIKGAERRKP